MRVTHVIEIEGLGPLLNAPIGDRRSACEGL